MLLLKTTFTHLTTCKPARMASILLSTQRGLDFLGRVLVGGGLRKVVSAGAAEGRKALGSCRGEVDHIFRGPDSEARAVPLYRAVLVNNYSFQGAVASEEKRK